MNKEIYMHLFVKGLHFGLFILMCDFITEMSCLPATNGRGDTLDELEDVFEDKVEMFKRDVLNKLGYARPPTIANRTKSIEENRRMIQQYKKYIEEKNRLHYSVDSDWEDEEEARPNSKTFYSVQYEGLIPRLVERKDWIITEAFRFYFENLPTHPVDDQNQELNVESSKLRVYVRDVMPENLKDKHTVDKHIRVNAYQVLSIHNASTYGRTLLDSILVNLDSPNWVTFDVSRAVQCWIDGRDSNLGIEIAAESQNIHDVIDIDTTAVVNTDSDSRHSVEVDKHSVNSTIEEDIAPVLHIYAKQRHLLKRVKRRSRKRNVCRRKDKETKCCRYPIKISFKDLKWDWILAPLEYKGYYCAGSCANDPHKLASTFAGIMVFMHDKKPKKLPAPCCHASIISNFTILHFDEKERYTFTDIPGLVVEQCKCG